MNLFDAIVYLTAVLICYKIRVYISNLWHKKADKSVVKQTNDRDIDVVIFVPNDAGDNPLKELVVSLHGAQKTVDICMYSLSAQRVVNKCIDLHRRGVRVRVISNDFSDKNDKLSFAYMLTNDKLHIKKSMAMFQKSGIEVRYFKMGLGYMHNKFAIIDDKILINGSFNWTEYGLRHNYEDFVMTNDQKLVAYYADQFDDYWRRLDDPMVAWTFPDNHRKRKKSY